MTKATDEALAWLEKRGLDSEIAVRMGWDGAVTKDGKTWLRVPYTKDGETINRKYRRLDEKLFRNDPGATHDLYNVDCLTDHTLCHLPLVITEGECDWLAVYQSDFIRSVSMPDGWTEKLENYDGQAKFVHFERNEDAIRSCPYIICAVDDDPTGHSLMRSVSNFFDGCDVRYVRWPEGSKDANDCLLASGVEAVKAAVDNAKPIDPPGGVISGFTDLPPMPPRRVWKLDYPCLDKLIAFRSRELSVLTGVPGSGKTTLATWMSHHLVRANDLRVGLALFESEPTEVQNHLMRLNGLDPTYATASEKHECLEKLDRNYRVLQRTDDDLPGHSMDWIRSCVHALAARDGCNVVIIDPWNELEHDPLPGESMTQYTNIALTKMRQWSARYDIHIMIVAHPRKMAPGERPLGYSIADSAAWANKPGMGYTIHNESDDNGAFITVTNWKVRSRQGTGCAPGRAQMVFDESAMVYRKR